MPPSGSRLPILLLTDANIVIDLAHAGALGLILKLAQSGIGEVLMPRIVFDEANELTESNVADYGIRLLPVGLDLLDRAQNSGEKRLSVQDQIIMMIADHDDRPYTVWTNDRLLRTSCGKRGISVAWCFEVLVKLVEAKAITGQELMSVAKAIEKTNPYQKGICVRLQNLLSR